MSHEDTLSLNVGKLLGEFNEMLGENAEGSYIEALKAKIEENIKESLKESLKEALQESLTKTLEESLKISIQDSLREELYMVIEHKVTPSIRNLEIQSACQVSKTNEFYAELKKITEHITGQISKLADQVIAVKSSSTQNLEKIEYTIKQLNKKADLYELQALAKEVSGMTPLVTFYQHQEWTQTLAPKTEIYRIDYDLAHSKEMIMERPTIERMLNEQAKIIVDLRSEISKEKGSLLLKINDLKEADSGLDSKIEMTKNKMQQNNEIISKKINEVFDYVLEKPWTEDVELLSHRIDTKATSQEISDMRNAIEPKMNEFIERYTEMTTDLDDYCKVMARFDEVILTKASKEDVKILQKYQNNFVLQHTIDPIITDFYTKLKIFEDKFNLYSKNLEDIKQEVSAYSLISSYQKTQAKDHQKLLDNMKALRESMKVKADKSDICSLFDIMGYRDDIINLSSILEKIKDLFHQAVVLQHEAMTTLLLSGDSPVAKNRHRAEITKNLESLMKRINSNSDLLSNMKQKTLRSKKNLSSMTSITLENAFDDKTPSSRTASTRHRRVTSSAGKRRPNLFT